jgi:predicted ABC-type ATPase
VFSHESKLNLIVQAQSLGFSVVLYVVAVTDPTVLVARVKQRVAEGGHFVPADRILLRYPRTLANLKKALPMVDLAFVYDAVDIEQGVHRLVALCERGQPSQVLDRLPPWAATLLSRG